MGLTKIKKGLNLPIAGQPEQKIDDAARVNKVAVLGSDYVNMRPTLEVAEGDHVKKGQVVFTDKKMPGVQFTAPGSGTVSAINRGAKRAFLSLVIDLDESEEQVVFQKYSTEDIQTLPGDKIRKQLIESGMWTSFRSRPFGKVANPEETPHSIFVTAIDTNPLAPNVDLILEGKTREFETGLQLLSTLTAGKVFVCTSPESQISAGSSKAVVEKFAGKHPAGLPGTHIHFLDPIAKQKVVWHIEAQDVVAIGSLFLTGELYTDRIVSLGGPGVENPRLLKTRVGADLTALTSGEIKEGEQRIVSGSVFSGHAADGPTAFLGRYHQIISVLPESKDRVFLGWTSPAKRYYSIKNVSNAALFRNSKWNFTTDTHGALRAIVPVGSYEKVMPLDIIPTYLLRALAVDDVEEAEKLGALELIEEDLGLCSFVCPAKIDHLANLRRNLNIIEKEG